MTDNLSNSKALNDRQPIMGEIFGSDSLDYSRILYKPDSDNV